MKKIPSNPTKTMLTISVGFLLIYLFTKWDWAIYVALASGLIGVFSTFLSKKVEWCWMKLAWLLSLVIPNIILSLIFFLFLFPIALLSRFFGKKDPLMIKNPSGTVFREVEKTFEKTSFEKPW